MNGSEAMENIRSSFVEDVKGIINRARQTAVRSVDFCRVQMYWNIGKRIFEEEQQGKERADYGSYLIKNLASTLEPNYGSGFSYRQLAFCRQFYKLYSIVNAVRSQLNWTQSKESRNLLKKIPQITCKAIFRSCQKEE